ncbi:short-chain dehydrogenase [Gammaproteobacteria bacterium 42_54_T18]|nr:short-chain dehydrogenase [Gammaproteobacteria bacterium 42_54_T18]
MLLENKVVIISGIGSGLGIELALGAAKQGAKLVVSARTESKLDAAEEEIRGLPNGENIDVIKVPTDICDKDQCERLVARTMERFGRIDCLINSAYNPGVMALADTANMDAWRAVMDVNVFGTMNLIQSVIPQMKLQRSGSIVNVNTMVTRKPMATQAGYAASKAALSSVTSHLALELGQYNIRVNSTYMGWMWGAPVEYYFKQRSKCDDVSVESLKNDVEKNIPLGRIPTSAECANAVFFLASDLASAMTGACLDVNGGEYLPR